MSELAIRTRDLGRAFGELWAVRGLDLEVRRGEIFGLVGPDGAGKTTTMRMLTGILAASEGEAEVVTWIQEVASGAHAGQPLCYDRFVVAAAPGGTELLHTAGQRSFGLLGRLTAPLAGWFSWVGMQYAAQRIGLEVADRQAA